MTTYSITTTPQTVASASTSRQLFVNNGQADIVLDLGGGRIEVLNPGGPGGVGASAVFVATASVSASTRADTSSLDVSTLPADSGLAGSGTVALDDLDPSVTGTYALRYDARALSRFRTALAARNTSPVDMLHIGDSVTWGLKAGSHAAKWTSVLRDTLRTRYATSGVTGGFGHMSAVQNFGADTFSDISITKTGGADGSAAFGIDQCGYNLDGSGDKITYTFTGTGADFFYAVYGGGGTFSVKVDGGTATNINTNGTLNYTTRDQSIRGLTAGAHTVELAWVSGGTVFTHGLMAYNGDETKGIRSWNAAWPGSASFYWADPAHPNWLGMVNHCNPALVTIELGLNDCGTNIAPATYKAQVRTLITNIKARASSVPSFVLIPTWPITVTETAYWWDSYISAMREIAETDADRAVCVDDWRAITGSVPGTTLGGILSSDFGHPSVMGNKYLGQHLADFLAPASLGIS